MIEPNAPGPRRVAVVGAGIVGLSSAWFLQEQGVEVTVFDRGSAGAGASWGNAGYLTPALTAPLPEPAVLGYGLRALLSPGSPLSVPPRPDPALWSFLLRFARNCTRGRWRRGMQTLAPLTRLSARAFDLLRDGGVSAPIRVAEPLVAAFDAEADTGPLVAELSEIRSFGSDVRFDVVDGAQARRLLPQLADGVRAGVVIHGQRFIDPGEYVRSLADEVVARGAALCEHVGVCRARDLADGVALVGEDGADLGRFDAVILAAGVHTGRLARPFGVRQPVHAGRGYSFTVSTETPLENPLYLPTQRLACTPYQGAMRIAGMMEFQRPDAPFSPRRVESMVRAARELLIGVDLADRRDEWVGSRPCTVDGLPLVGLTRSSRVAVAAGHGMWGVTLGPITGQLLARSLLSGQPVPELAGLDPCR